ncbi:MAG: hypothetical protein M0Q41_10055 [Bacteroidales bacterium]|nr:hypothetical protein [Bacteroidales bacterium]
MLDFWSFLSRKRTEETYLLCFVHMNANFCIIPHLSKTESLWRGFALRPTSFYQNDGFESLSHRVILHTLGMGREILKFEQTKNISNLSWAGRGGRHECGAALA